MHITPAKYHQIRQNASRVQFLEFEPLQEQCQKAIDFVNGVDDILLRPGGPVTDCSYTFYPSGCFDWFIGNFLGN